MVEVIWSSLSKLTLFDETNFILAKWNEQESDKFLVLVHDYLDTLSKTPTIGIFKSEFNCYSLVISKQTTLYYKIIEEKQQIELILFWNNSQNPNLLFKLLK